MLQKRVTIYVFRRPTRCSSKQSLFVLLPSDLAVKQRLLRTASRWSLNTETYDARKYGHKSVTMFQTGTNIH